MTELGALQVTSELAIPQAELAFRASRSGGPGGQHVNTSSTRVELLWDLERSPSLDEEQRARIREKLGGRINAEGILSVVSSATRSQHRNREDATRRFAALLADALRVAPERRPTRVPRAAREERLQDKKRRSETKRARRTPDLD